MNRQPQHPRRNPIGNRQRLATAVRRSGMERFVVARRAHTGLSNRSEQWRPLYGARQEQPKEVRRVAVLLIQHLEREAKTARYWRKRAPIGQPDRMPVGLNRLERLQLRQ